MNQTDQASRRAVLKTGLGALAACVAAAGSASAQDKLAPALVQYQLTPKSGQMCINCSLWVAPNACKIVSGEIKPQAWCVAFAPKS
jgi:anaerobic selenocysteine-containing dehydrogenase